MLGQERADIWGSGTGPLFFLQEEGGGDILSFSPCLSDASFLGSLGAGPRVQAEVGAGGEGRSLT